MLFIPLSSIIILHDPYFHEIVFPINAGHDKFSFVFDNLNIFVIIAFISWRRKWKHAVALPSHIKCKYVYFPSKIMKWTIQGYFCHKTNGFLLWQLYFIQQLSSPSLWVKQLNSNVMIQIEIFLSRRRYLGFENLTIL